MESRIFFKDDSNTLKGPFTEHVAQEMYINGVFKGSFLFYFKNPWDGENNGMTLDSLRSHNGVGCPFVKVDEKKRDEFEKRIDREERLERIEKVIMNLHQKRDVMLSLEKTIMRRMGGEMEELILDSDEEETHKPAEEVETENKDQVAKSSGSAVKNDGKIVIVKPDSITEDDWQSYYQLGNTVADFVLDALSVYASGRLVDWDKSSVQFIELALGQVKGKAAKGRNRVCEHVLVERLKEKEYFCCKLCMIPLFNYKQTLIHFISKEHCLKEPVQVKNADLVSLRRVLNSFTNLPARLEDEDTAIENDRLKTNSRIANNKKNRNRTRPDRNFLDGHLEEWDFHMKTQFEHAQLPTDTMTNTTEVFITVSKSEYGRRLMAQLDAHIGKAQTYCLVCRYYTGDRAGFYAHSISSIHMKGIANLFKHQELAGFDVVTTLINVHKTPEVDKPSAERDTVMEIAKYAGPVSMSNTRDTEVFKEITFRPEFISEPFWQSCHVFGNSVANLFLNAFAMYASRQFQLWPADLALSIEYKLAQLVGEAKKMVGLTCEHILVEKMKKWEFFCCDLCVMPLFNYKQTLSHFTSPEHCEKETAAVRDSGIDVIRRILELITNLKAEVEQTATVQNLPKENICNDLKNRKRLCPKEAFLAKKREEFDHHLKMQFKHGKLPPKGFSRLHYNTEVQLIVANGDIGQKMMAELHEHLGQAQTFCLICSIHTGDREGFYVHSVSASHLKNVAACAKYASPGCFDAITTLINVHRKDLI